MLETLVINNCEELEEIVTQDVEFQKCFPKLEYLDVEHCNKLKCVFSASSATLLLPHLCDISISECEELKELIGGAGKARSSSDDVQEIILPNLRNIILTELPSLVHIVGKGFKLPVGARLHFIQMKNCPKFSSIMGATGSMIISHIEAPGEESAADNGDQRLTQLPYLYPRFIHLNEIPFQELHELISIFRPLTSCQNLSFQHLERLTVHGCRKVKCLLSMSLWGSLPQLNFLGITKCEELEEIMEESQQDLSNSFPKLKWITVKGFHKLKCLFRTASVGILHPFLKSIEVSEAEQMEELFSHTSGEATDDANTQQIELPRLRTLKLSNLPALTHFCKGFNLNAPRLNDEDVEVNECPKFDFSLHQATSTQSTGNEPNDGEQ